MKNEFIREREIFNINIFDALLFKLRGYVYILFDLFL